MLYAIPWYIGPLDIKVMFWWSAINSINCNIPKHIKHEIDGIPVLQCITECVRLIYDSNNQSEARVTENRWMPTHIFGLDKCLMTNKQHAITWTIDYPVHWLIYAPQVLNE